MSVCVHQDVALVVRECGERTANVCVALLAELFPGRSIIRVSGDPFSATLRESLVQGLVAGKPWTLCIDADVFVLPALYDFIAEAKQLPGHYCEAQALVADKLLPVCRPAGNHLYRTSCIPQALELLAQGDSLRPESSMIQSLGEAGYPYHQSTLLIGLHDFEQSTGDLYNKASLHGHKHAYLADDLLPLWGRWAAEDTDYHVALLAFTEALAGQRPAQVSRRWREAEATLVLAAHSLVEKPPLFSLTSERVAQLLVEAPHRRAEATELRLRVERDVFNLIRHQRQAYAQTMPRWKRWLYRVGGRYPFFRPRA